MDRTGDAEIVVMAAHHGRWGTRRSDGLVTVPDSRPGTGTGCRSAPGGLAAGGGPRRSVSSPPRPSTAALSPEGVLLALGRWGIPFLSGPGEESVPVVLWTSVSAIDFPGPDLRQFVMIKAMTCCNAMEAFAQAC